MFGNEEEASPVLRGFFLLTAAGYLVVHNQGGRVCCRLPDVHDQGLVVQVELLLIIIQIHLPYNPDTVSQKMKRSSALHVLLYVRKYHSNSLRM